MTYFLTEQTDLRPRGPDVPFTDYWQGVGAATSQMMRDTNASFLRQREVRNETSSVAVPAAERLGIDALNERYNRDYAGWDHVRPAPKTVDEFFSALPQAEASKIALDLAREAADADPNAWKDMDLSQDGIEARVTKRRIAENDDEQQILDMMPNGRASAQFLGGMAGMMADVRQVPFLLMGGGGSLLSVMGREAFLNMAAEGITLPSQYAVADELDKPDPKVIEQLGMAAAGGAVLGGGAYALGRALHYFTGRQRVPEIPGMSRATAEAAISAVEEALHRGDDPFRAFDKAIEAFPTEPPPSRPPLIEERAPEPREDLIGAAEAQFAADFPEMSAKYPLGRLIQKLGGIQAKRRNPATGEMEATFAAQELASMGVTQKTHPFMFRKDGHSDLDNIVASEHPGLSEVLKIDAQSGYFDRDALLGALGAELGGGRKTPLSGAISARMSELDAIRSGKSSPTEDFLSQKAAPDGFFVNLDHYDFTPEGRQLIAEHFDSYFAEKWPGVTLTPKERMEILRELSTRGGDAEYLVERALEREIEFDELPRSEAETIHDPIPFPTDETPSGPGREGVGQPRQDGSTARRGGEGETGAPVTERTAAGEQIVAPGIEPVTTRQRLEAQQNAPKRGGNRPADEGLFDIGARQQMDMFSVPSSKEARVILDQMTADLRDSIKQDGDFLIDLGDGKGERSASAILDDLDEGDRFADRIALCGLGPT